MNNIKINNNTIKYITYIIITIVGAIILYIIFKFIYNYLTQQYTIIL